jgi:hypothetical protein
VHPTNCTSKQPLSLTHPRSKGSSCCKPQLSLTHPRSNGLAPPDQTSALNPPHIVHGPTTAHARESHEPTLPRTRRSPPRDDAGRHGLDALLLGRGLTTLTRCLDSDAPAAASTRSRRLVPVAAASGPQAAQERGVPLPRSVGPHRLGRRRGAYADTRRESRRRALSLPPHTVASFSPVPLTPLPTPVTSPPLHPPHDASPPCSSSRTTLIQEARMSPSRFYLGATGHGHTTLVPAAASSTEGPAWLLLQVVAGIRWASPQQSSPRGQRTTTTTSPRSGPPSSVAKLPCASNHLHQFPPRPPYLNPLKRKLDVSSRGSPIARARLRRRGMARVLLSISGI